MPANVVQGNRVDERQDDQRAVDGQQLDGEALAAEGVGKDLGWVSEQKRRIGDVVVEEEDKNKRNHDYASAFRSVNVEGGGAGGPDDEGDKHAGAGP